MAEFASWISRLTTPPPKEPTVAKTLPQIQLTDAQYARVAKIIPGDTA